MLQIGSEVYLLSHLRGRNHQEAVKNQHNGRELSQEEVESHNISVIINAPNDKIEKKLADDRERCRAFRKKAKKIRLRMLTKSVHMS